MYCLANEEMPRSEIKSLLMTLLEQMDIKEMKYFDIQTRPSAHCKDLVSNTKKSNFYALLTDEMSYILNTCWLVSFDVNKEKVDTLFPDCSNILEHSLDASPDADVFVTYGASVMTVAKGVMVALS